MPLNESEKHFYDIAVRIADALEGIRFALANNLATITQENNALRSSNTALVDTLRRQNSPSVGKTPEPYSISGGIQDLIGRHYDPLPGDDVSDPLANPKPPANHTGYHPRRILAEAESEQSHIENPDFNS